MIIKIQVQVTGFVLCFSVTNLKIQETVNQFDFTQAVRRRQVQ